MIAHFRIDQPSNKNINVLVIDAFSGDSVSIHLLTKEAFAQYFRHLKKDGVLALHITNRFLNLSPVVKTAADAFDQDIKVISFESSGNKEGFRSEWALISKDKAFFEDARMADAKTIAPPKDFKLWKDDYSSLLSIIW